MTRLTQPEPAIGILAGMGPSSTAPFLDMVYEECRRQYGARHDGDFPKIVLCSQPAPFFHDRPIDDGAMAAATIDGLRTLQRAGADIVAIACNSVHVYFDDLQRSVDVTLLNMVDIVMLALPPGARRVAFCTSRPLTQSDLYPRHARLRGLEVVCPPWQDSIDELQDLVQTDPDPLRLRAAWARLFEHLANLPPVDALVVACLDLSGTLGHAQLLSTVPVIDSAQTLAARLVASWLARTRAPPPD